MHRLLICMGIFLIAACSGGSGKGLDANGRPIGETPDPGDLPTLANIQARVFTPVCTQCHVGAAAPQGLRLDSANAFNDLVNVSSREVGSLFRVEPFDADNSYLVQKIEGSASVGGLMPLGGPPLPDDDIQLVRQWIIEGAMPGDTTTASDATKVVSGHVQGDVATAKGVPRRIVLAFTRQLDPTSVHAGSVLLTISADAQLGNTDDITVADHTVSMSPGNPYLMLIEIPANAPKDAWFRITLGSLASSAVLDLSGQPIAAQQLEVH